MSSSSLVPGKHVVVTDFDGGEGILVDLKTKKYYQLNETAMVVWKGLEKGKTLSEIVADITSSYEVGPEQAARSVQRIVDNSQSYKRVGAGGAPRAAAVSEVRRSHLCDLPATPLGVLLCAQSLSFH